MPKSIEKLEERKLKLKEKIKEIEQQEKIKKSELKTQHRKKETQAKIIFASLCQIMDSPIVHKSAVLGILQLLDNPINAKQKTDLKKLIDSDFFKALKIKANIR